MKAMIMMAGVGAGLLVSRVAAGQPYQITLPAAFAAQAVSGDGRVVVGADSGQAAYWNRHLGIVHLNPPMINGAVTSVALSASGNGSVIVGRGFSGGYSVVVSWVWRPQGVTVITVPGLRNVTVTSVSQDGLTIGGFGMPAQGGGGDQSFVWTQADGYRIVPWGSNHGTWINALSADGRKAAGVGFGSGEWPTYWGSTYMWCDNVAPIPGHTGGQAFGISGDGSTLVGALYGGNGSGFVWNAHDGLTTGPIGVLQAVSYDGRIAAGYDGVMWVRNAGVVYFTDYCASRGVPNVPGGTVVGMSSNARVFVERTSLPAGTVVVDLGACGSADFDHDGSAGTDADIEAFFRCLAGDCCPLCDSADFNYDGDAATDADIEAFFRVLAGGSC